MARQFNEQTKQELSAKAKVSMVNIYDSLYSTWEKNLEPRLDSVQYEWTQRYLEGKYPPHYPVPAIVACEWCASTDWTACYYNKKGEWCPSMCFE